MYIHTRTGTPFTPITSTATGASQTMVKVTIKWNKNVRAGPCLSCIAGANGSMRTPTRQRPSPGPIGSKNNPWLTDIPSQTYNGVELDPSQPPLAFKQRVCELTGVPVERQKLMGKGQSVVEFIV